MENKRGIEYINKKVSEAEKETDWVWWLLIVTSVITMVVALKEMLWAM
ncbi:unnamed protein product [marine sediment metagenome]|uniref:Uncharacterized protein n=1 Tax=marine sediment metagenome TaxID=412755 RepID=X1S2G8_9ZZZZ